jgi:hypothetical protein
VHRAVQLCLPSLSNPQQATETDQSTTPCLPLGSRRMHRHRQQTDTFRLYDAEVGPGEFTQAHRHSQETVYFILSVVPETTAWAHGEPGPPRAAIDPATDDAGTAATTGTAGGGARRPPGLGLLNHHLEAPLIHQVYNPTADSTFRAIGCEISADDSDAIPACAPLASLSGAQQVRQMWEHDLVVPGLAARMFKIVLGPGDRTFAIAHDFCGVMTPGSLGTTVELLVTTPSALGRYPDEVSAQLCFTDSVWTSVHCKQYHVFEPATDGSTFVLHNSSKAEVSVMLLQLTRSAGSGSSGVNANATSATSWHDENSGSSDVMFGTRGCCCCGAMGGLEERRRAPASI